MNLEEQLKTIEEKGELLSDRHAQKSASHYRLYKLDDQLFQVRISDHLLKNINYLEKKVSDYPVFDKNYLEDDDDLFVTVELIPKGKQIRLLTPIVEERYEREGIVIYSDEYITKVCYFVAGSYEIVTYPSFYALTILDEENIACEEGFDFDNEDCDYLEKFVTENLNQIDKDVANHKLYVEIRRKRKKCIEFLLKDINGKTVKHL